MTLRLTDESDQSEPTPPASSMRRLLVALALCILLAVACWVIAPRLGVYMPPIVPILGFVVIAGGTLLGAWESSKSTSQPPDDPLE